MQAKAIKKMRFHFLNSAVIANSKMGYCKKNKNKKKTYVHHFGRSLLITSDLDTYKQYSIQAWKWDRYHEKEIGPCNVLDSFLVVWDLQVNQSCKQSREL